MRFIGRQTHIDFIGKGKFTFIISSIIAIIGIIAIVQIARGSANLGIDFTGGISVQLKFDKEIPMEEARRALLKHGLETNLQEIKDGNKLLIKVGKADVELGKVGTEIEQVFKREFPGNSFVLESSTEIGPSIGDKLRKDTLVAIAIAMLGIIIYIAWRFDFKFGVAAAVATAHDVLAMFSIFYLAGKEINLLFIVAVLTVAGYSLTDTVVVFDRIRENMRKGMKETLETIFNNSINEVLSRTIVTTLTTLLAALSLLFFGGEVIHDFALALVVGILVGTYSSVFVASPLVVLWEKRSKPAKA